MNVGERTEAALASAGVHVRNRKLEHIESKKFTVTELERIHLERAAQLGGMILEDVSRLITPDEMIGTEGLSFASKGNQYLNLVEYRSIMFSILFGAGYRNVYTYSPITIKGVAGCSKKLSSCGPRSSAGPPASMEPKAVAITVPASHPGWRAGESRGA